MTDTIKDDELIKKILTLKVALKECSKNFKPKPLYIIDSLFYSIGMGCLLFILCSLS